MTRPHIIRADTIDLQDKTSPTAQDHQSNPHPAPLGVGPAAPHQQATLRAVEEERETEEVKLANGLSNDPGSDDESTVVQNGIDDNAAVRLNGGISGDDAEMADADAEEDLDDMDDRISSSPSISDGSLPSPSPNWRKRASSSSPNSPPSGSSSTACDSSSPFTDAPIHFPLSVTAARRPFRVPAGGADISSTHVSFLSRASHSTPSTDHHQGEYWPRTTPGSIDDAFTGRNRKPSPRTQHLTNIEERLRSMREDSQGSLMSDLDDSMLKPVPSPLHDHIDDVFIDSPKNPISPSGQGLETECNTSAATPPRGPSRSEESDSWTTDSDCDSWDDDLDDDDHDISFSGDPRFIDSGWGGECLTDTEDIDFEFVYALHTFVATVEGQANATKGDTMVLLDDSNSYWWLVRVVKDSSIGYLPAEHIETPTERLARLNKHRNIDLSATMLGDTAEKVKNPLKKAMRRRNAKNVQFAPPTYVEASDYDYSSDEGGDDELFGGADPNQAQVQQQQTLTTENVDSEGDDGLDVQPLKLNGVKKDTQSMTENDARDPDDDAAKSDIDKSGTSDENSDRLDPKVSRNGTVRNTDSFFKDENTETRKITLTPNLLRDDSSTSTTGSRERGPSLESLEKNGFADKVKKDDKKKEKKSGMLSGLFKRKDKKPKGALDSFDSDAEKQSEEFGRSSPQSKPSDDLSAERPSAEQSPTPSRQSSKGKLQKPQRPVREDSPSKTKGILKTVDSPEPTPVQPQAAKEPPSANPVSQATSTMRLVAPEQDDTPEPTVEEQAPSLESRPRASSAASKLNPINMLKTQPTGEPKPEKVKKAKQRVQLDDFDSEEEERMNPFADPDAQTKTAQPSEAEPIGRLSESPVHVSAADAQPLSKENAQEREQDYDSQHPPGLTGDTSSQETSSPISTPTLDDSPSSSRPDKPSLAASRPDTSPSRTPLAPTLTIPQPSRPAPMPQNSKEMEVSPLNSSESTSLPAWSDSSLRSYLDDGSDIRDMLLVIHDTTGVVPVGNDHPLMAELYVEESKAVSSLSSELDSLLSGLLEKRIKRAKSTSPTAAKAGR